jgi:hypothetical protein
MPGAARRRGEATHEGRLPDAGLTGDEDQPPAAGVADGGERVLERPKRLGPFEQLFRREGGLRHVYLPGCSDSAV